MDMSSMVQAFTEGVEMLQTVQNTMRTASESFTHDGLTQPSDVYELYEATQVSEATQVQHKVQHWMCQGMKQYVR
ncbi:hypothetical protein GQ600_20187 [Phytophthora cactorum]|nr:hypothetical protein GQ600_20187 [Phytophthora cactorum]